MNVFESFYSVLQDSLLIIVSGINTLFLRKYEFTFLLSEPFEIK